VKSQNQPVAQTTVTREIAAFFAKELTFVCKPYFRNVVTACAFSSSVAESEQDKTTLQRVVMNRAWPKP
jgi:hypothetical protein